MCFVEERSAGRALWDANILARCLVERAFLALTVQHAALSVRFQGCVLQALVRVYASFNANTNEPNSETRATCNASITVLVHYRAFLALAAVINDFLVRSALKDARFSIVTYDHARRSARAHELSPALAFWRRTFPIARFQTSHARAPFAIRGLELTALLDADLA